jgi:hypothetical protein
VAVPATVVYGDDGSVNWHDPDIRPHGFILGQMFTTRLHWIRWGAVEARAGGIIHVCQSAKGCNRHSEPCICIRCAGTGATGISAR